MITRLISPNVYIITLNLSTYITNTHIPNYHKIGVAIVSGLASSAVDREFEPQSGQTKIMKLVFVVSPLSTRHNE